MGIDSILLTHAEVAIAFSGFASVAAVPRRPGLVAAMLGLLAVNLLVVPTPGFGLYHAALLVSLVCVFLAFTDVVIIGDDEPS